MMHTTVILLFLQYIDLSQCRWRLVIHGGIDGYARILVYLKCNDNNQAETVLNCFLSAVTEVYGIDIYLVTVQFVSFQLRNV